MQRIIVVVKDKAEIFRTNIPDLTNSKDRALILSNNNITDYDFYYVDNDTEDENGDLVYGMKPGDHDNVLTISRKDLTILKSDQLSLFD
jgi:hypothetical protein